MRRLSHWIFTSLGWKFEGRIPDIPKMVIVGAPHTSNWDFFLFLAALHHFDLTVRFLAKQSLFRWPFGFMFRKVGGIPVDRSKAGGIVRQVKAAFDAADQLILVIAPEGTRKAARQWKSGFVEIAESADVPVVLAGVDGRNKVLEISPPHRVGENRAEFMNGLRAFFADKSGINPKGKGPVRLASEISSS